MAATIFLIRHGTFVRDVTGRGFANCEVVRWTLA